MPCVFVLTRGRNCLLENIHPTEGQAFVSEIHLEGAQ